MQFLDDAGGKGGAAGAASDGQQRDIAQFVPFNLHSHNSASLTRETLKEIPNQLVQFLQQHNIQPLPPIKISQQSLANLGIAAASSNDGEVEEEIDLALDFKNDEEIVVASGGNGIVRRLAVVPRKKHRLLGSPLFGAVMLYSNGIIFFARSFDNVAHKPRL